MDVRARHVGGVVACVLVLSGCSSAPAEEPPPSRPAAGETSTTEPLREGEVTLAFGGDVHFEGVAGQLLDRPRGMGSISRTLRDADVAMVNISETGVLLETNRYLKPGSAADLFVRLAQRRHTVRARIVRSVLHSIKSKSGVIYRAALHFDKPLPIHKK